MGDFIRQLAKEAGRTSVKASCSLRRPGENNDSINAQIRRKSGRVAGALDPEDLDSQIREAATANDLSINADNQIQGGPVRICTGTTGGRRPSITEENLSDLIVQALLDGGAYDGF